MIAQKYLLLLLPILLAAAVQAQRFQPDSYGHVEDPAFLQLIKERGYQLVGSFVQEKGTTIPTALVRKDDTWVYLDINGVEYASREEARKQLHVRASASEAEWDDQGPHIFAENGKSGLKSGETIVLEARFNRIAELDNGFYEVVAGGKAGVYDSTGKEVIPMQFSDVDYRKRYDRFICTDDENDRVSISTGTGEVLFTQSVSEIGWFHGSLYRISTGSLDNYGLLDIMTGAIVLPCSYYSIGSIDRNRVAYTSFGILDKTPERLEKHYHYHSTAPQLHGVLDSTGKIVIPPRYEELWICERSGYIIVLEKSGYGVIGFNGEVLLPSVYSQLVSLDYEDFEETTMPAKLLVFAENGKYGVMTVDNQVLVKPSYDRLRPDCNGLIAYKGERFGMIRHDGSILLPFRKLDVYDVFRGIVKGEQNGKKVEIDLYGNTY